MSYQELTPVRQGRYDGYMDTPVVEQARPKEAQLPEVAPAPLSAAAKSLIENYKNDAETGDAPKVAKEATPQNMARDAMERASKSPTRDYLVEVSRNILKETNPNRVRGEFSLIENWSTLIERGLDKNVPEVELRKFEAIRSQIKSIASRLDQVSNEDKGLYWTDDASISAGANQVLGQRTEIAEVASRMKDYFDKTKLIEGRPDYFKPITSFEEFMVKIADFTTKDEFRPGGKHQLLEIKKEKDMLGREITEEIAHPENFILWMRDQLEFFHDFSPTTNISLFQDISIPTAVRAISLGEILYGATSDTYFSHRIPKVAQVYMTPDEITKIVKGNPDMFEYDAPQLKDDGSYSDGTYKVKNNGEVKTFIVKAGNVIGYDDYGPVRGNLFFDQEGNPVYGIDLNKDNWNTEKDAGYDRAKNDVLWEAFLLTNFHNYSVLYRIQAMQSEAPLKEKMAEVFGLNMMTDSRERLLRLFRMQSVDKEKEVQLRLEKNAADEGVTQGSVGKAMQRANAGYYHLSEASAAANGYGLQKDAEGHTLNAFTEVMKGKHISGSEEFYKALINLTFEQAFADEIGGIKELVDRLNQKKINGNFNTETKAFTDDFNGEALRDRKDWEKVQLSEVAFLSRDKLLPTLQKQYRITPEMFDEVYKELQDNLENGYTDTQGTRHNPDGGKLKQLKTIGDRKEVLRLLVGKNKIKQDMLNEGYMRSFIDAANKGEWDNLDVFAVKFLAQTFAGSKEGGFTDDANIWSNISYDHRAIKRVRQAMRHAISHTEQLSDFESLYAEEWAFVLVYQTGISARNDMNGIGHDAWSKIQNTEYYRLRQSSGGNNVGNYDNLYGVHRLGVNVWEGLKVQRENGNLDATLYEVLTGLEVKRDEHGNPISASFDINKDVGTFDFYGNAERQFFADHMGHTIDLFVDITQKHEFNIANLINEDGRGRYVINHGEMQKFIDVTWKHMRYGFDNRALAYDNIMYGWWYDEEIIPSEYKNGKPTKIGQVKRTPRFGFKTLRDLMFSHEVQIMNMYNRPDVSGWAPGTEKYKMGRNVFAYLISKQLEEHTKNSGDATLYNADQVAIIVDALMSINARVMKGEHGEAVTLSGFFNAEETLRILVYANAMLWKLYGNEYGFDAIGGIFAALLQMLSLVMKETGAGITLGK